MRQLSKRHKKIISVMSWYKYMYVRNETILRHIIDNYKFLNLCLYRDVTDKEVKELKNCHTIYLFGCKNITDECIKELKENGCIVNHE